tara:strand:+ start:2704 stop:3159 length:456 start_codon:yes stop_codon:yes gene_type:complete
MPYSENSIELMKKKSNEISNGISGYMLDTVKVDSDSLYPNDPSIKYQNSGLYKNSNSKFMDVNSEILNITRPLTKDVNSVWTGGSVIDEVEFKDLNFSSKYSRLDEPAIELRGQTKNRWIVLPIDPQENAIEPFKRLGTNTHLSLVDHYNC